LTEQTIKYLEDLKNGDTFILTKDSPNEIYELILNLKNLGLLHKPTKFGYACDFKNRKYLTKLIELNSWTDFLNWLDGQNSDSSIVNNFSGSTIGQVNQSDFLKVEGTNIKQNVGGSTTKPKKNYPILSKLIEYFWPLIISIISGIILLMIERGIIDIGF
jgi:hypothetical protein